MSDVDLFIEMSIKTRHESTITVKKYIGKQNGKKMYSVHCSLCSADEEMWPEGSVVSTKSNLLSGRMPCGCGAKCNYTSSQNVIRAKRSANKKGLLFISIDSIDKGSRSIVTLQCVKHGRFSMRLFSFLTDKTCQKCGFDRGSEKRQETDSEFISRTEEKLSILVGQKIIKRIGARKCLIRCDICAKGELSSICANGEFVVNTASLRNGSFVCMCSSRYKWSDQERSVLISERSKIDGYEFVRWDKKQGTKNTMKDMAVIFCVTHGESRISVWDFLYRGSRCFLCTGKGFNYHEAGFVYALKSTCGAYIKVGISNDPLKRISCLKKATPFAFTIQAEIKFDTGTQARNLEKNTHSKFMSAGLSGFDGCTEWLRYDPEIIEYIQQRAI